MKTESVKLKRKRGSNLIARSGRRDENLDSHLQTLALLLQGKGIWRIL